MAWLFSCFRCKQRQHCRSSSPKASCQIAAEIAVLQNTNDLEVQEERAQSSTSLEKNLDALNHGNDVDRNLLSYFSTETQWYSPKKQSSVQPLLQKEKLLHAKEDIKRVKDLKSEANDLRHFLNPPENFREAHNVESEEGQAEKVRHMASHHSLLIKIQSESEILVDNLMLKEQNKSDANNGVDMGEKLLLSSTENESQLYDIEDLKELHNFARSFSPATQAQTDIISPGESLLERTLKNQRGCSSETKVKHSDRREDCSFESNPLNIGETLVISRSKRCSKALSFSEFSLVEAAAGSKFTSKKLEFEHLKGAESSILSIDTHRMTASKGEVDDGTCGNLPANVLSGLPTWSEQAISFSLSQDVAFYDTDMEVDSKAVEPCSNKSSPSRPHGIVRNNNAHEMHSCADLTMEQSQEFTFDYSYTGDSKGISHLLTESNGKRRVLDEEVKELDFDQMSSCSDASSFLVSPLPQVLLERDDLFARKRGHLYAPSRASQESVAELSTGSFNRTISKEINSPKESTQSSGNIADMVIQHQLLPLKSLDDVTSRQGVIQRRRLINMIPESSTDSHIDYMEGIACNEFASVEVTSFTVPSPETVTYMKKHIQSPSPLGAKREFSSTQSIIPNSLHDTPSMLKSVLENSSMSFLKQQSTPRTPSASSLQVETPTSLQSAVSPSDLAKDRPIMGTVAAHWSHFSSKKWWDGKGIPNSTNKYKEDQKVSWHATPFEVQLERALDKQGRVFQKNLFGGAMPTDMELRTDPITSSG